jgi:hypothetical protein
VHAASSSQFAYRSFEPAAQAAKADSVAVQHLPRLAYAFLIREIRLCALLSWNRLLQPAAWSELADNGCSSILGT